MNNECHCLVRLFVTDCEECVFSVESVTRLSNGNSQMGKKEERSRPTIG